MLLPMEVAPVHLDCVVDNGLGDAGRGGARGTYAAIQRGLAYYVGKLPRR